MGSDCAYLIRKLLHPLARIDDAVRRARLNEFWLSLLQENGHMLKQEQVGWIVQKEEGKTKNIEIAEPQGVSVSGVQQLHREYRKMGEVPVLKKAGRPKSIPSDQGSTFYAVEARER